MHLTEFQKEIIKSIIDHEVNDIESFFRKFCELTEAINQLPQQTINNQNRNIHT